MILTWKNFQLKQITDHRVIYSQCENYNRPDDFIVHYKYEFM